jgi:hypothetical protein
MLKQDALLKIIFPAAGFNRELSETDGMRVNEEEIRGGKKCAEKEKSIQY